MNGLLSYQIRYFEFSPDTVSGIEAVVTPCDTVTLESMQEVVGGLIETMTRFPSPYRDSVTIDAYVNEEGMILNLPAVMGVLEEYGIDGFGTFCGNIVFVGSNQSGESIPLTEEEIIYIQSRFESGTFNFGK